MNWDKRCKILQSRLKIKWSRFGLIWVLIFIGIANPGCKKENTNNDDYYVKYEVNSSTIYSGGRLNVVLTGTNNQNTTFIIATQSHWETTIGPVKKGFNSNLSVSEIDNNYGHLTLQSQISVSKNSSPFALKQFDNGNSPRTSVQINYTIDY